MAKVRDSLLLLALIPIALIVCIVTLAARLGVDLWQIWNPKGQR